MGASWAGEMKPKAKNKNKPPKPDATTLAFREYERVSFYLATKGDFNFVMDDEAREAFFTGGMANEIGLMTANRIAPDEEHDGRKIPKGEHIDGLHARTVEREKQMGKKVEKQAAVKTPKAEKLDATPSMRKLLKKKGASSVDESGSLLP